jgi:hypothetical protein
MVSKATQKIFDMAKSKKLVLKIRLSFADLKEPLNKKFNIFNTKVTQLRRLYGVKIMRVRTKSQTWAPLRSCLESTAPGRAVS